MKRLLALLALIPLCGIAPAQAHLHTGPLPPLHAAADRNDVAFVQRWVREKQDVDSEYNDNRFNIHGTGSQVRKATPLMVAAERGNNVIVKLLVEAGADIYRESRRADSTFEHESVFDHAIEGGDPEVIEYLWSRSDKKTMLKRLPRNAARVFDGACRDERNERKSRDVADFFLKTFDSAILVEGLWRISDREKCLPTIRSIVDRGVRPDAKSLVTAASRGNLEIVTLYLSKGAPVDQSALNEFGPRAVATPLLVASTNLHLETMALLLEKGADPNFQDAEGKTPLMYAVYRPCKEGCRKQVAAIKLLLQRGARTNIADRQGRRAIDYTDRFGDGADANVKRGLLGIPPK